VSTQDLKPTYIHLY